MPAAFDYAMHLLTDGPTHPRLVVRVDISALPGVDPKWRDADGTLEVSIYRCEEGYYWETEETAEYALPTVQEALEDAQGFYSINAIY